MNMLNPYQLGQLTAKNGTQIEETSVQELVLAKYASENPGIAGAGAPDPSLWQRIKGYADAARSGVVGASKWTGEHLGGVEGQGFFKNPHTRTIAALLALLGAGYGGYRLTRGDEKER